MARRLRRYRRWMGFEVTPEVYFRFMGRFSEPLAATVRRGAGDPRRCTGARRRLRSGSPDRPARRPPRCRGRHRRRPVRVVRRGGARPVPRSAGPRRGRRVAPPARRLRRPGGRPARRPLPGRPRGRAHGDGPGDPTGWDGRGERVGPRRKRRTSRRVLARGARPRPRRARRGGPAGDAGGAPRRALPRGRPRDVVSWSEAVGARYETVDEWWATFTLGVGPAGPTSLARRRRAGRAPGRCAELLPAAPFEIPAVAWCARGSRRALEPVRPRTAAPSRGPRPPARPSATARRAGRARPRGA